MPVTKWSCQPRCVWPRAQCCFQDSILQNCVFSGTPRGQTWGLCPGICFRQINAWRRSHSKKEKTTSRLFKGKDLNVQAHCTATCMRKCPQQLHQGSIMEMSGARNRSPLNSYNSDSTHSSGMSNPGPLVWSLRVQGRLQKTLSPTRLKCLRIWGRGQWDNAERFTIKLEFFPRRKYLWKGKPSSWQNLNPLDS